MEQISPLIFQVVTIIVLAVIAFLFVEWRKAKQVAKDAADKNVPPDWLWVAQELAKVGVRAAYQKFAEIEKRLPWATEWILEMLDARGFKLSPADQERMKALIEAAWAEFKNELKNEPKKK